MTALSEKVASLEQTVHTFQIHLNALATKMEELSTQLNRFGDEQLGLKAAVEPLPGMVAEQRRLLNVQVDRLATYDKDAMDEVAEITVDWETLKESVSELKLETQESSVSEARVTPGPEGYRSVSCPTSSAMGL